MRANITGSPRIGPFCEGLDAVGHRYGGPIESILGGLLMLHSGLRAGVAATFAVTGLVAVTAGCGGSVAGQVASSRTPAPAPLATSGASTPSATPSTAVHHDAFTAGIVICLDHPDAGQQPRFQLVDPQTGAVTAERDLQPDPTTKSVPSCNANGLASAQDSTFRYRADTRSDNGSTLAGAIDGDSGSFVDLSGFTESDPAGFGTVAIQDSAPVIQRADDLAYWTRRRSDKPVSAHTVTVAYAPVDGSGKTVAFDTEARVGKTVHTSGRLVSLMAVQASPSGKAFLLNSTLVSGLDGVVCPAPTTTFVPAGWVVASFAGNFVDKVQPRCTPVDEPAGVVGMTDDTHWVETVGLSRTPVVRSVGGPKAGVALLPSSAREISSVALSPDGTQLALAATDANGDLGLFTVPTDGSRNVSRVPLPAGSGEFVIADWL